MILKFKELHSIITEINTLINNGLFNEAYSLSKKSIKDYPYSTELYSLYLILAQLSDQNDLSLDDIKEQLFDLMEFQGYSNVGVIIDNIGIRHNILDEKSKELETLFISGYNIIIHNMKDFMELYFDYLSETGRKGETQQIINEVNFTMKQISVDISNLEIGN